MQVRKKNWQIAGYSAFALAYLQLNQNAFGQVLYHDIEPDSILDERSEYMAIDFDENGLVDFGFLNSSFTFYFWSFETYIHREDILAVAFYTGNSIMCKTLELTLIYYHFTYFYPYALRHNELVSAMGNFNDYGLQTMGKIDQSLSETYSNHCFECPSMPSTRPGRSGQIGRAHV